MKRDLSLYETEVDLARLAGEGRKVVVLTHGQPVHSDDLLAIIMIAREAGAEWVKEHAPKGVVLLDVPGSRFSDKTCYCLGKRKTASTSVLVARSLGILDLPAWAQVVRHVNRDDLNGSSDKTDLDTIFKRAQQQEPSEERLDQAAEWLMQGLAVKVDLSGSDPEPGNFGYLHLYRLMKANSKIVKEAGISPAEWRLFAHETEENHRRYFENARSELEELQRKGAVLAEEFFCRGRKIRLLGFRSDNYRAAAVTRAMLTPLCLRAEIVVQQSGGGVMVACDHKDADIDLREAAAFLRYRENWRRNGHAVKFTADQLRSDGTLAAVPEWFFNPEMGMGQIYNSLSHGAPPTSLSLVEICQAVRLALSERHFHPRPEISRLCFRNICVLGPACPNLQIGVERCKAINNAQIERRKKAGL